MKKILLISTIFLMLGIWSCDFNNNNDKVLQEKTIITYRYSTKLEYGDYIKDSLIKIDTIQYDKKGNTQYDYRVKNNNKEYIYSLPDSLLIQVMINKNDTTWCYTPSDPTTPEYYYIRDSNGMVNKAYFTYHETEHIPIDVDSKGLYKKYLQYSYYTFSDKRELYNVALIENKTEYYP
jgi:hypothetical protein